MIKHKRWIYRNSNGIKFIKRNIQSIVINPLKIKVLLKAVEYELLDNVEFLFTGLLTAIEPLCSIILPLKKNHNVIYLLSKKLNKNSKIFRNIFHFFVPFSKLSSMMITSYFIAFQTSKQKLQSVHSFAKWQVIGVTVK